jgi:alpha-galactosidase
LVSNESDADKHNRRCEKNIREWEGLRKSLTSTAAPFEVKRSVEYGSAIIHSLETGIPRVVYGNVPNTELITNLPAGCCVEVPCLVDKNGIQAIHVGAIPSHLAALMQTNIHVQELTVEALLTRNRDRIYHAAMLDPHTAAELDLDQIWQLVDELLCEHGDWIPREFHKGKDRARL